jgi:hypothetical protein
MHCNAKHAMKVNILLINIHVPGLLWGLHQISFVYRFSQQ